MDLPAKHSGLHMTLGPRGEVCSIRHHTSEFCVPAAEAFTMQLLDRQGNALDLKSSDFAFDGTTYTHHPALPGLTVTVAVSADGDTVRFRPRVTGIPQEWVLSWFDGPHIVYPMHQEIKLLLPLHDGVVIDDPQDHQYHPIGFAKRGTQSVVCVAVSLSAWLEILRLHPSSPTQNSVGRATPFVF